MSAGKAGLPAKSGDAAYYRVHPFVCCVTPMRGSSVPKMSSVIIQCSYIPQNGRWYLRADGKIRLNILLLESSESPSPHFIHISYDRNAGKVTGLISQEIWKPDGNGSLISFHQRRYPEDALPSDPAHGFRKFSIIPLHEANFPVYRFWRRTLKI